MANSEQPRVQMASVKIDLAGFEMLITIDQSTYNGKVEQSAVIKFVKDGSVIYEYAPWRDEFNALAIMLWEAKYKKAFPYLPAPTPAEVTA